MLATRPDFVLPLREAGPGWARTFTLEGLRNTWVRAPRSWTRTTDDTGVGNPAAANAERGRRFLAAVTARTSGFLAELANTGPENLRV
jgi:creatinine amidohydrolase